jgi:purine-nucleoside phosphorylase
MRSCSPSICLLPRTALSSEARALLGNPEAAALLADEGFAGPRVGLILGSGWGHFIDHARTIQSRSYADIPGFGVSTVPGHAGRLVRGSVRGREFLAMQGRLHVYEGYPLAQVAGPVALLEELGVRTLIVTNAAGGIDPALQVGDLVRVRDFIHFMLESPLRGAHQSVAAPSGLSERLGALAEEAARDAKIPLKSGVLFTSKGPTYETPAEVRMAQRLGADLVSMSTTPELIAAGALGIEAVAFSCVTNMAPGIIPGRAVRHEEVIEVMNASRERCAALLAAVLEKLEQRSPGASAALEA